MATATIDIKGSEPALIGRWVDNLFGYNLFFLLTIPAVIWLARSQRLDEWPIWVITISGLVISGPHYGATLLRVYEKRHDRRRYALFTVWLTLALLGFFVVSLYSVGLGSFMLTAYVCWSPWHLAGQNFGVAMMTLRRRNVPIDIWSRRFLHASYLLAYVLAMLALHTGGTRSEVALGADDASIYYIMRLGIPPEIAEPALWILGPLYLAVTIAAFVRLGRGGHVRHLGPTLMLTATYSLWYVIPALSTSMVSLIYAAVWLSINHSVQYLWITTYFAKRNDSTPPLRFLGKCLLAGSTLSVVPALLFVPGILGSYVPYVGDAEIMVFTIVNLHHFVLDGAIWKLRDGRVGQILLNQKMKSVDKTVDRSKPRNLKRFVYALGALGLATPLYFAVESKLAVTSDSHSFVEGSASRLAFWGKDFADVQAALARHRHIAGDSRGAVDAYRRAYEIAPENIGIAVRLAALLLDDPEGAEESLRLATIAAKASEFSDPAILIILGSANARLGRIDVARDRLERALLIAERRNDATFAAVAREQLRLLGGPR